MKKYTTGFLVLGMLLAGAVFVLPGKASAGALTSTQISNIINLMSQYGTSASTNASITSILNSPTATGTTTTTTTTNSSGCGYGYTYDIYNGGLCSPQTSAGTSTTTTSSTTSTNANPTGGTTTTTTTSTTNTSGGTTTTSNTGQTNYCYSNVLTQYAYNIQNGLQCVKTCPLPTASGSTQSFWNASNNTICPATIIPPSTASIIVEYPNGAEMFDPGEGITVKWDTTGISSSANDVFLLLNYYTPGGAFITNTKLGDDYTTNDGMEEVKLPTTLPAGATWGNYFKVLVGVQSHSVSDISDKYFVIE